MSTDGMHATVSLAQDAKTAGLLGAAFGLLSAAAVPSLLAALPADVPPLPLPLPLFCIILALQMTVIYGGFALAGLRLARGRALEPAPLLTSLWTGQRPGGVGVRAAIAFAIGMLCGALLLAGVWGLRRLAPESLPSVLHPPSVLSALLASAAASVGEEILCRLFLLSAILRVLPPSRAGTGTAVVVSAVLFGVLHAPALVVLFGGAQHIPAVSWVWLIAFNGILGVVCGCLYVRWGIGSAVLVHFGTDLVWHVFSQLM